MPLPLSGVFETSYMSENVLSRAVLNMNVKLIYDHERYVDTVKTRKDISVANGRYSQHVWVPSLYNSAAPLVAYIRSLDLPAT